MSSLLDPDFMQTNKSVEAVWSGAILFARPLFDQVIRYVHLKGYKDCWFIIKKNLLRLSKAVIWK